MSKMNMMETVVLDVMNTHEGVKIMEFQQLGHCALGGYYSAYGQDLFTKVNNYYHPDGYMSYDVHHPLLKFICDNKGAMGAFVTPYASHLFPKQKVYAFGNDEYSPAKILKEFPEIEAFVFKEPEQYNGHGVFIVSREELARANNRDKIARFFRQRRQKHPKSGLFLVQEAVRPKPVETPNGFGGTHGLPTIRVVMTVCPRPEGKIEFVFHGGYYKFPDAKLDLAKTDIQISSKTEFQLKSNCLSGGSCKISDSDYQNICDQIEIGLSPFFRVLMDEDHQRMVIDHIMSDNLGDRVAAAMFVHKQFERDRPYDIMTNAVNGVIERDSCFKLLMDKPRIWEFHKHPYCPA
jgi:hypothetical protein